MVMRKFRRSLDNSVEQQQQQQQQQQHNGNNMGSEESLLQVRQKQIKLKEQLAYPEFTVYFYLSQEVPNFFFGP